MVSVEEIRRIAALTKMKFTEEEIEKFAPQFNKILGFVEKLNELDLEGVEPLIYPVEVPQVLREDELRESVKREDALKNAPDRTELFFKFPNAIG